MYIIDVSSLSTTATECPTPHCVFYFLAIDHCAVRPRIKPRQSRTHMDEWQLWHGWWVGWVSGWGEWVGGEGCGPAHCRRTHVDGEQRDARRGPRCTACKRRACQRARCCGHHDARRQFVAGRWPWWGVAEASVVHINHPRNHGSVSTATDSHHRIRQHRQHRQLRVEWTNWDWGLGHLIENTATPLTAFKTTLDEATPPMIPGTCNPMIQMLLSCLPMQEDEDEEKKKTQQCGAVSSTLALVLPSSPTSRHASPWTSLRMPGSQAPPGRHIHTRQTIIDQCCGQPRKVAHKLNVRSGHSKGTEN